MQEYLAEVPGQPFVVTTAGTLRDAVAAVGGQQVVLLDLSLPDAHGIDTISRMAEVAEGAPIIVLTGNTDQDMALRAVAKGADDYLLKSEITTSLIARTILYAVERRRRARQMTALEVSRAESEHSARRARFLADLSSAFAIALDVDDVIQSLIKVAVPELGDYCGIDLVGGDQRLRRAAVRVGRVALGGRCAGLVDADRDLSVVPGGAGAAHRRGARHPRRAGRDAGGAAAPQGGPVAGAAVGAGAAVLGAGPGRGRDDAGDEGGAAARRARRARWPRRWRAERRWRWTTPCFTGR